MPIIYRIEHISTKDGPYHGGGWQWQTVEHTWENGRPGPANDGIKYGMHKHEYCGFRSITHLRRWFTKRERYNLSKDGFILAIYDAPEVRHGNKQSVFTRSKATLLETVHLTKIAA